LPPGGGDTTYIGGAELGLNGGGILYYSGVAYGGNLGGETGPFNVVGGETW
jgi:hypothetical protein